MRLKPASILLRLLSHAGPPLWLTVAVGHIWLLWASPQDQSLGQVTALVVAGLLCSLLALVHRRLCRHPMLALVVVLLIFATHPSPDTPLAHRVVLTVALGAAAGLLRQLGGVAESRRPGRRPAAASWTGLTLVPPTKAPVWVRILSRPPPLSL